MTTVQRRLQVVVKVSKFCNLRCRYCYEYDELGNRERIDPDRLHALFTSLHEHLTEVDARDGARTGVDFIWHGGEPLMLEPGYYRAAFADLRAVFGERTHRHVVQTNLTRLDDDRLALLRDEFDSIGVSFDVVGGLRVNLAGRDSTRGVAANMLRLREHGVRFGCITVLTAANAHRVDEIFDFYERQGTSFRVLPLFDGAFADQHAGYDVDNATIVSALTRLFDRWLASPSAIQVSPLDEYTDRAIRHLTGAEPVYYNRREWLDVILVNTDGEVYAFGDPFDDPRHSLGNAFTTGLREVFTGPGYDRSASAAELRMAANCVSCPFFGACSGSYVADGETSARDLADGAVRACVVERAVIEHIAWRLRDIPDLAPRWTAGQAEPVAF
ncbi:radical SAM protein [Actinosynnema sp. NPDC050436]|uniref:radical SAM protein n=1 Tax=Actinosynnema sp. NPDC050436 TaxID=3155659 RepID=UPI0033D984BE